MLPPHLRHRDLNRVLEWMSSELSVGHHRVGGGDRLTEPRNVPGGLLGADYDVAATPGSITESGLRNNIAVGIRYLGAWLAGSGAVAIFNLMEDAATAEISRSQVWQWVRHGWHVAIGYVVGFMVMVAVLGWNPHERVRSHEIDPPNAAITRRQ